MTQKFECDRMVIVRLWEGSNDTFRAELWNYVERYPGYSEPHYIAGQFDVEGNFQGETSVLESHILGYESDLVNTKVNDMKMSKEKLLEIANAMPEDGEFDYTVEPDMKTLSPSLVLRLPLEIAMDNIAKGSNGT